jgi:hypothetical protein
MGFGGYIVAAVSLLFPFNCNAWGGKTVISAIGKRLVDMLGANYSIVSATPLTSFFSSVQPTAF